MDGSHFDNLARSFATSSTRRRFFAGLVGVAAGLVGRGGAGAANCRAAGQICREHTNCCSNRCGPTDSTGRRRCACPSGSVECNGKCLNQTTAFQTDPANCGACGVSCPRTRCQIATCTGGVCGTAPDPTAVGRSCNDKCSTGGICQADGTCTGGTPKNCDDNNPCTIDTCNPQTGQCVHTPKSCNDNNPCTIDSCDPELGCIHVNKNCDDNNPCTVDTCDVSSGQCVHTPKNCNDNNACTTDTCDVTTGQCVNTPLVIQNPDLCTIRTCDAVQGIIDTPRVCNDNNPCTTDTCDPARGCVFTPINTLIQSCDE
jgi:hypothetical protein